MIKLFFSVPCRLNNISPVLYYQVCISMSLPSPLTSTLELFIITYSLRNLSKLLMASHTIRSEQLSEVMRTLKRGGEK